MKVAAIVPAYNEEQRISRVLQAVLSARLVDEIIVVSDGSSDRTAEVASSYPGVRVIRLPENVGKGGAMWVGVRQTNADVIVFLDADLVGLQPYHVDALIEPVMNGCDMTVGIFKGGKLWSDAAQAVAPFISGQRAVKRQVIEWIPWLSEVRSGAEVAINHVAKKRKLRMKRVILRGVSHTAKEAKFGLVRGTAHRARMYAEIGKTLVRARRMTGRKF